MVELKKYTKDDVIDLELDELEILINKENVFIQSGESLLEALLNTPFKSKKKVDEILEKIKFHKDNIDVINFRINEIKYPSTKFTSNQYVTNIASNITYSYRTNQIPVIKNTTVKYIDEYKNVTSVYVVDDIFQSVLGNYYITTISGEIISLNRVVEIDEDSILAKWYETMRNNFERELKLNRVLKDETEQEDS